MENSPSELLRDANVLVTGATGFTGSSLIKKLVARGARVRAIARNSSNLSALADLNVSWFRGNVYDQAVIDQACLDVHYIFHVAAAFREAKVDEEEYSRVHVKSTELLAKAALRSSSFQRFIHVSTMGVHGHIENPPGNEESPFSPGDTYQRTKAQAELWFRDFASKHNLPHTVIRPTAIYGPGDRRLLKIFRMATFPVFPILGYGKCLYHLIHVEDLTEAMLVAASHPAALSEAFIVGNAESIGL